MAALMHLLTVGPLFGELSTMQSGTWEGISAHTRDSLTRCPGRGPTIHVIGQTSGRYSGNMMNFRVSESQK